MSRLVARILLAMLMFPLAAVVYLTVWYTLDVHTSLPTFRCLMAAGLAAWVGVAVYWTSLWRAGVPWTRARVVRTAVASALAVAADLGAQVALTAFDAVNSGDARFAALVVSILVIAGWLLATVFLWRETPAERAARLGRTGGSAVTCPSCGYNLTGLAEARCPECGTRFTLDELLAGQPAGVAAAELA